MPYLKKFSTLSIYLYVCYIYVCVRDRYAKESRCFCAQTLKPRGNYSRPTSANGKSFLLIRQHERFLYCVAVKHHPINTPTRRHRDISQTKLRTSVLLRQRVAERLVLAFAICKSPSRGALRYRDPRVPSLFFADSHLVVLRNSILESCRVGKKKKGAGREKEAIDGRGEETYEERDRGERQRNIKRERVRGIREGREAEAREDARDRERERERTRGRDRNSVVLSNGGKRTRGKERCERRNSKIVENVHAPSSGWPRFSQDLLSRQHFSLSSAARETRCIGEPLLDTRRRKPRGDDDDATGYAYLFPPVMRRKIDIKLAILKRIHYERLILHSEIEGKAPFISQSYWRISFR